MIVLAGISVFILGIFFDILGYFMRSSLFEQILWGILIFILIIAAYLIIKANNPVIKLGEEDMVIGHQMIPYDQVESYFPSKGGSEPYIITKEGTKMDLEISWFSKKDRIEIKNTILEKIKTVKKK